MKRTFTFLKVILPFLFFTLSISVSAQVAISGTQFYTQTVATTITPTTATVNVANPSGFAINDKILVIQMQGAVVNQTNTAAFGSVSDYNGAGNYEIAQICDIVGNALILDYLLDLTYDPAGIVQIIKIPIYADVVVNGTVDAPAWNGSEGGVFVLEASNLILAGNIDMSGKGFRGGTFANSGFNCTFLTSRPDYFYPSSDDGGQKGESIAVLPASRQYGKGACANGGGGGNDHNAGGAGGSNTIAGGLGGENGEAGFFNCKGTHPGIGGYPLFSTNRLFLGGGGGAGQGNNNVGTSGGTGGGIVIIIASQITGNSNAIISNGLDVPVTAGGDGGGGGGAGGSVFLECPLFTTPLNITIEGGDGGSVSDNSNPRCWGPGGGGSGGIVKFEGAYPAMALVSSVGGVPGTNVHPVSNCQGSPVGATAGTNGEILNSIGEITSGSINNTGCDLLAVELTDFMVEAEGVTALLEWSTASELNNDIFFIERSQHGEAFKAIGEVTAIGNSTTSTAYHFVDRKPNTGLNYYRIKSVDIDGLATYSEIKFVRFENDKPMLSVYPNPAYRGRQLTLEFRTSSNQDVEILLYDMMGRKVITQTVQLESGISTIELQLENQLGKGTYILQAIIGEESFNRKVSIL